MTNLKCHEYQCKYNQCSHCSKNELSISEDAFCKDYHKRTNNDADCNFEFSYEEGMSLKQDEHMIMCNKTSCLNNCSGECGASYIRIDKIHNGARCCQVREK